MNQMQAILVLLVEDEFLVRSIACEGLEDAGFEVVEANDAEEALEVLSQRKDVGVLFTDVNMPGSMDGLDLAKLVHKSWPAIRLVVTSGRSLALAVPDDGHFISKPYSMEKLTEAIHAASSHD